jgi:hypothetical protein
MRPDSYSTPSGIVVERTFSKIPFEKGLRGLMHKLDTQRGIFPRCSPKRNAASSPRHSLCCGH